MKVINDYMAELEKGLQIIRAEAEAAAASTSSESSADLRTFADKMASFHAAKSADFGCLKASGPLPRHDCSPVGMQAIELDGTEILIAAQALDSDARKDLEHMTTFLGEKFNAKDPTCLLRTMEEVAEMVSKAGRELHVSCNSA